MDRELNQTAILSASMTWYIRLGKEVAFLYNTSIPHPHLGLQPKQ